mmetsp:Transcript_40911/g.118453  ORF Transcript_40911/g.118453 Transcript_40911/m.118453 type:complete len:277 (+) Transcript_40911:881-1711(+)
MGHELAERRFLLRLPATAGEDGRRELLLVAGVAYAHAVPIDPHHARQLLNARFPRLVGEDHHRQDARLAAAVCGVVECRAAVGAGEYDAEHLRALVAVVGLDRDVESAALLPVLKLQGAGHGHIVAALHGAPVLRRVLAADLAGRAPRPEHLHGDVAVAVGTLDLELLHVEFQHPWLVLVDDHDRGCLPVADRAGQQVDVEFLGALEALALHDLDADLLHAGLGRERQSALHRLVVVDRLRRAVARGVLDLHRLDQVAGALDLDGHASDGLQDAVV